MSFSGYDVATANWREQLRRNEKKTRYVIATFVFIYAFLGVLVDIMLLQSHYPQATLSQCAYALFTGQVFPWATCVLMLIAGLSLFVTFQFYDKVMLLGTEAKLITSEQHDSLQEQQLYHVVEEMKIAAGMDYMPRVYIIEATYMNAFASGYSEKSAMVAITRGLLEKLTREELKAVMAHELSHIRHHDIKLTLTVSVLSNLILLVIDALFWSMIYKRGNRRGDNRLFTIIIILRYTLPLITALLTLFLSRTREYMADAGAVELMRDNQPMASALLKISQDHTLRADECAKAYGRTAHEQIRRSAYLYDPSALDPVKSIHNAFSTHPSISDRLKAIGFSKRKQ